jgi:dihydrofolate reductase
VAVIRALIVAHDRNGVIGVDGRIPWRCRGDQRMFRALTLGCPVIMGRRTWESLPMALVGREVIVVSRTMPGAARSLSEAWRWAELDGQRRVP